jgi:hypothetical protein
MAKCVGLVPVRLAEMPARGARPVLDNVTGRAVAVEPTVVLANASGFGLRDARGRGAVPVPVRVADCGEPVALSATEIAAVRAAAEPGVKVTGR